MLTAIGYVRVSTDEQADDGDSLEAQRARLLAHAPAAGLDLVDVVEDAGRSAKTLKRPGLQRALVALADGAALALVATKLDRLTRRCSDLEVLLARHFGAGAPHQLVLAAEPHDAKTHAGKLTLRILVALAEFELDQTAERTRVVLEHRRSTGRAVGGTPLGFTRDGDRLVEDAAEQVVLARALALRAAGVGLHAIARQLTADGHQTKRGGRWRACTVVKLLARAARGVEPQ